MSHNLPRILLVEDDTALSHLYQLRLERDGFEVRQCTNGEAALQAAKDFKPHLILLDLMMPHLNGFDVLDILRNTPETRNIKIVVLSALSTQADQQRALDLGADDYLIKSQLVIADVINRIRQQLGLPAKQDG
jgi:DNA-binding response OmpR family regulator